MTNFWAALSSVDQTQPVVEIEYRLYYDENTGEPLSYSTEELDETFIQVTAEQFNQHRYDVRVKNGKLVQLKPGIGKLVPADSGTKTDSTDISLISTDSNTHWKTKTYELD
jgi:hypothetical protein